MNAMLNVSWKGQNGYLPDAIDYDSPKESVKAYAAEAIFNGSIPGIDADQDVDIVDFEVDRTPASGDVPAIVRVRPKASYGG